MDFIFHGIPNIDVEWNNQLTKSTANRNTNRNVRISDSIQFSDCNLYKTFNKN